MTAKSVSTSALTRRIRRALAAECEHLCIPRSQRAWNDLGIHVVNSNNAVTTSHCSLSGLATELGLLKPNERLAEEQG